MGHPLTRATVAGVTTTFVYDGDGKRVSSTTGGVTTRSVYDAVGGLPVLLDDGSRSYVWGAAGLAYTVETASGALSVAHADGLGSIRALSDGSGVVVQTYGTDEFGIVDPTLTAGSTTQPMQYTGERRDASTGLVDLRARVYDPTLGRFLQRDPYPGVLMNPQALNRYTYVRNNPVTLTDPSGLDPLGDFAHQMIESVFIARNRNFSAEVVHKDPTAPWWNPLLGSIRIDLEDTATGVFYEIKPWNELQAGQAQVAERQNRGFIAGGPQPDMYINGWIPGLILHAWWQQPGLLLYEWTWEPPAMIPFPFPLPGRQPSRLPRWFPNPRPAPVPVGAFSLLAAPAGGSEAPPGKAQAAR